MTERSRCLLYMISALLFAILLVYAFGKLPPFGNYPGPYGDLVMATLEPLRHTPQGVAAVTFDYRGFDTLGEEFILFTAVAGSLLLMRSQKREKTVPPQDQAQGRKVPPVSDGVYAAGLIMFPFSLILGIYIVAHGHLTPGGGFQGGVLLASAFYFIYLSGEFEDLSAFVPDHAADLTEAAGAAGFALLALLPLFEGRPFMENLLPLGKQGELVSGGTLPLFNTAVGIEVGAAFVLLICAFLRQVLTIRRGEKR